MDRYHEGDLASEISDEENRRRLKKERELKKLQALKEREGRGMKAPRAEAAIQSGHIRDFTDSLLDEAKMMYESLGILEDRLAPILRPSDLNALVATTEDTPELSPISYQLNTIQDGLRANRRFLHNLMDRIDL